ncbi:PREDICTED: uncharacterized protein LOC109115183 [Nelumbo nucifera]|uniref:Uncharacterized protein LOC109115183 n=1 Tax=Nelumbo nucifera TaxID=4432 RepID=A0A1U8Q6K6_NELNU|nr:PREDICTED: uncharacterized protein LOC109115183 [Nelumbo nucifera]
MAIGVHGKLGYMTGEEVKLETNYSRWVQENYMSENVARAYQLRNQVIATRQGDKPIVVYFSTLKTLRQEIDHLETMVWESSKDAATYQKLLEKNRVFEFLAGLKPEYDIARLKNKKGNVNAAVTGDLPGPPTTATLESVAADAVRTNLERYRQLLSQRDTASPNPLSGGQLGKEGPPWVSGASKHMTHISTIFSSYQLCYGRDRVSTTDGSHVPIAGKEFVKITNSISLPSVLHVPRLSTNLLSFSSLTKNLNCSVIFSLGHCVLQDLISKRTIGSDREVNGIYFLDALPSHQIHHVSRDFESESMGQIMPKHNRWGHLSSSLHFLFPKLFEFVNMSVKSNCSYTPQQNGVVERKNGHIVEIVRSMMITSTIPVRFWGDVVLTTVFLINRVPSCVLGYSTPFSLLFPEEMFYIPLKVFGCVCFAHVLGPHRSKLDPKAKKYVFLGYAEN